MEGVGNLLLGVEGVGNLLLRHQHSSNKVSARPVGSP